MRLNRNLLRFLAVLAIAWFCDSMLFAASEVNFKLTNVLGKYSAGYALQSGETVLTRRSGITYIVETRAISSKDELERYMKETSGGELDIGQQKMLSAMDFSNGTVIKGLLALGERNKGIEVDVEVEVFDTTFVNDVDKMVLLDDFWPCSYAGRNKIDFSTCFFNAYSTRDPESVLVHEISHAIDKNVREADSYGPDGNHSSREVTMTRAAYKEGWAEYNQLRVFPGTNDSTVLNFENVIKGGPVFETSNASYTKYDTGKVSGEELLNVEGVNALIMLKISRETSAKQVETAFVKSNASATTITNFLSTFVNTYPGSMQKVFTILNDQTFGTLEDSQITGILGSGKGVMNLLKKRAQPTYSTKPAFDIKTTLSEIVTSLKALMIQPKPLSAATKKSILTLKAKYEKALAEFKTFVDAFTNIYKNPTEMLTFSPGMKTKLKAATESLTPLYNIYVGNLPVLENFIKANAIIVGGRVASE
ncbi:MAG: hypothetical protein HQM10_04260 [Candidatus Riflebacteria bacterium]|nr:hypothetical protein [Candidatus Riflebacteria bacterium]